MASRTIKELEQLFRKLSDVTFRGASTGKWYPEGSQTAYYHMEYSPARLVLHHKSPSASKEERFEVTYRSTDDYNCASINIYMGEELYRTYTSEEELQKLYSSDEGSRLLFVYLFNDPRIVLSATETASEIPPLDTFDKAYQIIAYKDSFDPIFGITVMAEFFLKDGMLKMMRVRNFIGEKEIQSQNRDVTFEFNSAID